MFPDHDEPEITKAQKALDYGSKTIGLAITAIVIVSLGCFVSLLIAMERR